ncbi:MAG: hypothetical protein JWL59_654 [Chthoniobacteraceae bacterium]|nr:hypothetical protein [Chthoniobacteraceae bacterium]
MDRPPLPQITTVSLFRLMLWVQWRSLCARIRGVRRQSPLLLFVLSAFIIGYLGAGYWIFKAGLGYLYHFPLVGSLLSQRILFLVFGFFFMMLAFSNLIIGYSTLFKNRETQWFLSLPISHRNIYQWKFCEALAISSWALIFLSAPMMIAYGRVHSVSPEFYPQVAMVFLPFVVIPALAGSWGILCFVRIMARRNVKRIGLLISAAILLWLIFGLKPVTELDSANTQEVVTFDKLLHNTRLSLHPLLPSAWLTRSVLAWSEGLATQGYFYFLLLLSNAMLGLLLGFEVVGRCFYESWTISLSSRAERFQRKSEAKRLRGARHSWLERACHFFLSPPAAALVVKDVRLFWRDPAQWIQFMVFFGLLCIYVLNVRNVAFDFKNPFWDTLISYLNLSASSLTLSTLTTRFVFPQFSLEGRRIWILGLSPMGLPKVLLQKFWLSCLTAMVITVSLMATSSTLLHLPWSKRLFFMGSVALMSAALSGLAVGLGALFPNFKEENPSKIVSSFGGTLCLILSFVYIALFVGLASIPDMRQVTRIQFPISDAVAWTIPVVMSACLLFIPMILASRQVKNMEI